MDNKKRIAIQSLSTLFHNANLKGFFTGKIYQGKAKTFCVPGLNCYSCPGATGACPIGSLQSFLSEFKIKIPYYVVGFLIFFGCVFGRIICGFLCPFGFIQDLINKIPFPKKIKSFKGDKILRKLKYVILIVFVIILPIFCKFTPAFCKYICPAGTLSGLLLAFSDTKLFAMFSSNFMFKACILGIILLLSVLIFRPFCKYLCPLGAFYSLFNKIAFVRMDKNSDKCSNCGACSDICPMNVNPAADVNNLECIRCGKCINACPENALSYLYPLKKKDSEPEKNK